MTLNSVVLPAPLGPITPRTSPRETSSDTSSSAVMPPNATVTPRTARPGWVGSSLASTGRGSYLSRALLPSASSLGECGPEATQLVIGDGVGVLGGRKG